MGGAGPCDDENLMGGVKKYIKTCFFKGVFSIYFRVYLVLRTGLKCFFVFFFHLFLGTLGTMATIQLLLVLLCAVSYYSPVSGVL